MLSSSLQAQLSFTNLSRSNIHEDHKKQLNDLFHEQYADIHKYPPRILKMSVIEYCIYPISDVGTHYRTFPVAVNSNVRTETFADNILQEANHRFEKVFQILLSDDKPAEILQNSIHSIRQVYCLSITASEN